MIILMITTLLLGLRKKSLEKENKIQTLRHRIHELSVQRRFDEAIKLSDRILYLRGERA